MSTLEIELQELRERNNELVKKVQYWKMTAAQRENEKLDLMKENNDLRLKLSRLRSGGAAQARKLDAEIQSASKQALSHLVQASSAVTRTVQLAKTYMQERQEMETALPRWSSISNNTPSSEKVHRVLPMLIGGQSIQPVVSLSRTMVNLDNLRTSRSQNNNQNHSYSERGPLPMHMLQDLYIPLTRIDANGLPVNSMDVDPDADAGDINNSTEDLGLDDSGEQSLHESQNVSDTDQFDDTRTLEVVDEAVEPEDEAQASPNRPRAENPLEGPSWMLDGPSKSRKSKTRVNLEPDSTTQCDEPQDSPSPAPSKQYRNIERQTGACEFSPTVRRRKRTSSPAAPRTPHTPHAFSPRPAARRNSNNGRILKVLVSKLRLEEDDVPPPKRPSLQNSPSRPGQSPARRDSVDSSRKHAIDHSSTRDSSPMTSPTKRHPRNKSPTRRQSRDKSPPLRVSRDKSPSLRLSRDMQLLSFDAPSPNGATTSHVVISESTSAAEVGGGGEPAVARRASKLVSRASGDVAAQQEGRGSRASSSDSGSDLAAEGQRTRRPRKAVVYKEKPLNRKMRR